MLVATSATRPAVPSRPEAVADDIDPRDLPDLSDPYVASDVDHRLVTLARARGAARAALAELARWLVQHSAWERLGYARLSDYAGERLGISSRSVRDLGSVGSRLACLPALRGALVSGRLGWTKVRLAARVAGEADEREWVALARILTAEALSREVRRVDLGSVEAGAGEQWSMTGVFEVPCMPDVTRAWACARAATRRVAGRPLHVSEGAEMIAAEVLSAIPLDPQALDELDLEPADSSDDTTAEEWMSPPERDRPAAAPVRAGSGDEERGDAGPPLPDELERLIDDAENADAFELDRRMRAAVLYEQRLDARLGALLRVLRRGRIYRLAGFSTIDSYARERLGIDPSKVRALLRVERAACQSPALSRAYRAGRLSALQAETLSRLVAGTSPHALIDVWVSWARRISLRRLRGDVEAALVVREADPAEWSRSAGLPADAWGDAGPPVRPARKREIGARQSGVEESASVRFFGSKECVRLFKAVLCTVRRRVECVTGRLPTPGEGLLFMIEHALDAWGEIGGVPKARAVFARDGWRCAVPGCSSMQNLHAHHIRFRSVGGGDEPENLVTLCAFHHLRGVHAGTIRCSGTAPDKLRLELGVRGANAPLAVYESGDRLVSAAG